MPYRKPDSHRTLDTSLWRASQLMLGGLLLVLLLQMLLPLLLLVGIVGAGIWLWRRRGRQQQALHQLFYEQIRSSGGAISVLDFAIAAKLTGPQARAFLDARAREFYADFEPTDHGDILYRFYSPGMARDRQAAPVPRSESDLAAGAIALEAQVSLTRLSLTTAMLAARLNCSVALLEQKKAAEDFAAWAQQQDPQGQTWRYDSLSELFYPALAASEHS